MTNNFLMITEFVLVHNGVNFAMTSEQLCCGINFRLYKNIIVQSLNCIKLN